MPSNDMEEPWEEPWEDPWQEPWDDPYPRRQPAPPDDDDIASQNESLLRRQGHFRLAAEHVAGAFSQIPEVRRVVLFGSVAAPLRKEVPRFYEYRRWGIEVWHECRDVDLAVWVSGLANLKALQRARSLALNDLLHQRNIGVAHHQMDIFLMEPGTDRYLGRLCCFGSCPKGKDDCRVPGCGASRFLKQHERFAFRPEALRADSVVTLYAAETTGDTPPG